MIDGRLPFDEEPVTAESRIDARDRAGRERAVDPRFNVALEASAGTGKTRVLVDRYVNLLREGVDPGEILALTFTRKAAAEMRERIITMLRLAGARGEFSAARWRELRDRTGDVAISTIDAFCLSLLREFPLEADLDPGFQMADKTEVPRLVDEALDRALRTCRSVARQDEHVALVFAQLGDRRARKGLASLLNRRIVAPSILGRYLSSGPRDLTVAEAARRGANALLAVFESMRGGLDRFLETGPLHPTFRLLLRQLRDLERDCTAGGDIDPTAVQEAFRRVREHFLTQEGEPRKQLPPKYKKASFASVADWQTHKEFVVGNAQAMLDAHRAWRRDLNVLVSRGVWRMFRIAEAEYRRTLDARALLDFPDVLLKTIELLRQMEEFAQSRFRLESRYHHVLVDEFQDTSRAQWDLVSLLVQAWGEGAGLAHSGALPPSIFIVGDRKQSIYGFRDADVSLFREASEHMERLRPGGDVRRSISRSFRSVPPLLSFVNDLCDAVAKLPDRPDAFVYEEQDRFPVDEALDHQADVLGIFAGDSFESCARTTATEIARLIGEEVLIRDRETGIHRPVRAGDFAILFRTRESHREYERALEERGISAYVYKGLGFFDADEVKDVLAILSYLADPVSNLRSAALLRSRFVRISDEGLRRLGPNLADSLSSEHAPAVTLDDDDKEALRLARASTARWRSLADWLPPAELLDRIIEESAYARELTGVRLAQARENLKKIRAIIRRIQNRGYATLERIVTHLDHLAVGDEANAVIDATNAVSLMTVHASKGLEFPVVFVVNVSRGTGNWRDSIRIAGEAGDDVSVSVGDFESRADEDEPERDREETKRLLYVALTRARDRLYMGSVVKEGRFQPTRGSLGEVLPPSMHNLFVEAAAGLTTVSWTGASQVHVMRVCPGLAAGLQDQVEAGLPRPGPSRGQTDRDDDTDFAPLDDRAIRRVTVSALSGDVEASTLRRSDGDRSSRWIGILVHRLLQREEFITEPSDDDLRRMTETMLDAAALAELDDPAAVIECAVTSFKQISSRAEVRDLYRSGHPYHEVPFTMAVAGRIVRGTIDCLITSNEKVTVLEFKTGRPHPEHQAQAEVYRAAAEALFPAVRVESRLVYTSDPVA